MQRLIPLENMRQIKTYIDENAQNIQEAKLYQLKGLEWVNIVEKDPSKTFEFSIVKNATNFFFRFTDTQTSDKNKQPRVILETEVTPWFDFRPQIDSPHKAIFRTKTGFFGVKLINDKKETRFNFHTLAKLGL